MRHLALCFIAFGAWANCHVQALGQALPQPAAQAPVIQPAPLPPPPQRITLRNGRPVEITWTKFSTHSFALYVHGETPYANNERFSALSADCQRSIQWAAEEQGIRGDIQQHLIDSRRLPVRQRIVKASPLVVELVYGVGVDARSGREVVIPFCAVRPEDRQAMALAATQLAVLQEHRNREDQKVRAAQRAAAAAEDTAWAARQAAMAAEDTAQGIRDISSRLRDLGL